MRPIIFTFNIRRSVFESFGLTFFEHLRKIRVNDQSLTLLPIVTTPYDNIEARAQELARKLPLLMRELSVQQVNLISYSLSGIDARYAIAKLGLSQYCRSLSTISSPHLGSKAAELAEKKVFPQVKTEPIARLLGVGLKAFYEANPSTMKRFNNAVLDKPNVKYYSIGSERLPEKSHLVFRELGNYLRHEIEKNFPYENDGVFGHDEVPWGEHLMNFEADHGEIVGIPQYQFLQDVFELLFARIADETPEKSSQ